MLKRIVVNLEEIEGMLYFWQATKDKEKVAESYLHEIAGMPGLSASYDKEFTAESVRKVLSAITNRERLSSTTPKEGRLWNNHMWMMEDLGYTGLMAQPVKTLNLDDLVEALSPLAAKKGYETLEVRFSPLSTDEYIIDGNRLIINFFRVRPGDGAPATIEGQELKTYVKEKLAELLQK